MSRSCSLLAMRIIVMTCAAGTTACSALIQVDEHQCNSAAQCVEAELGDRCERNVCVTSAATCKGSDCASDSGTNGPSVCASDRQCRSSDAPRCMRGTCVGEDVAELWLCDEDTEASEEDVVEYSFDVLEFVSRKPPKNLAAKACRTSDADCSDPIAEVSVTDDSGLVKLELPNGYIGFIEVTSDALPALSYVTRPIRRDQKDRTLQVSAAATVELLAMIDGSTVDTDKGVALLEAFDCSGRPSGGVHFEESRGTAHPFYIVNHAPNSDVKTSVYDAENDVADGGFLNVDPGFITFTARLGEDGLVLGEFNARVRASAITFVDMYF